jgi:hypothetical protein
MHLYADSNSGFMTGTEGVSKKAPDPNKNGPPEKMHVQITTNGKFVYDMIRDTARFDSPLTQGPLEDRVKVTRNLLAPEEPMVAAPAAPKHLDPIAAIAVPVGILPPAVASVPTVASPFAMPFAPAPPKTRKIDDFDVLICDHLDLQFRRKTPEKTPVKTASASKSVKPVGEKRSPPPSPPAKTTAPSEQSNDKEIDFAIATADAPRTVRMNLIAEDMDADAIEMRYFAATAESGPRSILKGRPVIAYRQGHRIECPELHLKGSDKDGNGQEGFAKGPGRLDLLDKATGKRSTHIFWKNSLTSMKDREDDRLFDLLTLRGDPIVIDDERKQDLKAAQYLHLWLEQVKDTTPGAAVGATKQVPYKILGIESVSAHSPQTIIHNTNKLTVLFSDKPGHASVASAGPVAPTNTVITPIAPNTKAGPPPQPTGFEKKDGPVLGPPTRNDTAAAPEKKKTSKPIEITAGDILAFVADSGAKKELTEMLCTNEVHIHQASEVGKEKDKGLDITGGSVELKRAPEGDILVVTSDGKNLARLQSGEMLLFGPVVTIDQILNRAKVDGRGILNMPSNKTLDGKPKEGRLNVIWSTQMDFNGSLANFEGKVQATQDDGRMLSRSMQVTLDRPIDFKQGQHGDQKSAVDKIVCDSPLPEKVFTEDVERDSNGKLITYRRLELQVMEVDNKDQRMDGSARGSGGVLDSISRGGDEGPLGRPDDSKARPKATAKTPMGEIAFNHTRIRFTGSMASFLSPISNGRKTTFHEQVRAYYFPGSDPNVADPTTPVKGSLFLTCESLEVTSRKVNERVGDKIVEKTYQEMFANGGSRLVNFQTDEYTGNSKTVKFDERTDIILFEGAGGVPATIYMLPKEQGGRAKTLSGQKILYNRKTGNFTLDGVNVISSWLTPVDPPKLAMRHMAPGLPRVSPRRVEGFVLIDDRTRQRADSPTGQGFQGGDQDS